MRPTLAMILSLIGEVYPLIWGAYLAISGEWHRRQHIRLYTAMAAILRYGEAGRFSLRR